MEFMSEEQHDQMFAEVKVSYRILEVFGLPDVDQEYDSDFASQIDAEYDQWLNKVRADAWDEGHNHCFHVEDPKNKKRNPYRKDADD